MVKETKTKTEPKKVEGHKRKQQQAKELGAIYFLKYQQLIEENTDKTKQKKRTLLVTFYEQNRAFFGKI